MADIITITSDAVVVGSGAAGLTAALRLRPLSVSLVTKGSLGAGTASSWAQGGIAAAVGADDSPAFHAADTLAVGSELSDEVAVRTLTTEGPAKIEMLLGLGARFDRDDFGELRLGREAAHSRRRIVHSSGDSTGAEVVRVLVEAVTRESSVSLFEDCFAIDLVQEGGRVGGVMARYLDGTRIFLRAPVTILATGGIGRIFQRTTNPPAATGDGVAMAVRAGAKAADMEFVQFHPTALAVDADPMPLLTEALRGEGAVLIDSGGHRFMPDEHTLAELAPRDVVSRACWNRISAGNRVFLDCRSSIGERFPERFPTVFNHCRDYGIDPRTMPIPVSPAAHYHIGGVSVNESGRSSLSGLWACGECAATGVHGANRLASNSLLEALVFGARVADDVKGSARPVRLFAPPRKHLPADRWDVDPAEASLRNRIRGLMWEKVGLVRDESGLRWALEELGEIDRLIPWRGGETANMLLVARLVAAAALERRESRGVHFRLDFPIADPQMRRRLVPSEAVPGTVPVAVPECSTGRTH